MAFAAEAARRLKPAVLYGLGSQRLRRRATKDTPERNRNGSPIKTVVSWTCDFLRLPKGPRSPLST